MADEVTNGEPLDENQLARRIVEQATGDGPECPKCGEPMEKRYEHRTGGRFGTSDQDVRSSKAYFVCSNGHEVRTS